MFRPRYQISPPLLATLKRIAVQVYALNQQRPPAAAVTVLHEEALDLAAAAVGHDDERIGANYRVALLAWGGRHAADFDLALLLRIYFRLSAGVVPAKQRGRLRRGARSGLAGYQAPEPKVIPVLLNDLLTFVQEQKTALDPLLLAGIFHRQLLLIRPFEAANEPAAWLATRILLADLGLERFELLALERRFQSDRDGYQAALGARGNYYSLAGTQQFTSWLEVFAQGIAAELDDLAERYRQHRATPETMLLAHHQALLEYVDAHGFITDKQYAQLTDRAKATRSLDFKKLMKLGLLVREGRGRGTYYRRRT
jgi:Fic family protein